MEGRTIVRPDVSGVAPATASNFATLQWRAGQSSGQTSSSIQVLGVSLIPSMEGRTIVRPDVTATPQAPTATYPFNGGPDNRPARHAVNRAALFTVLRLQWRAGQSSGQTPPPKYPVRTHCGLQWRAGQSSGQTRMTGRPVSAAVPAFNGGPDNRPARLRSQRPGETPTRNLQWRAGQSSGQTMLGRARFDARLNPSMEGRTIVRPDLPCSATKRDSWLLQWRAGQSSGQTRCNEIGIYEVMFLQWRAGQSSGQTFRI